MVEVDTRVDNLEARTIRIPRYDLRALIFAVAASAAWFGWLRALPIELSILLILGTAYFGTLGMFSLVDEDKRRYRLLLRLYLGLGWLAITALASCMAGMCFFALDD
jgi:predicted membrane channel-forming protein YqfA (hemolysin III family)